MKTMFSLLIVIALLACNTSNSEPEIEDHTPPTIISVQPAQGASEVPLDTEIRINYSEPFKLGNWADITVNNKTVSASISDNQLLIDTELKEQTDYVVNISEKSVLDEAQNYAEEFTLSFSTRIIPKIEISTELVTENPSKEAKNVYNFLLDNYGEKIVSSAMANVSWNTNEAEWVKQHTGNYPAMATFDYIFLNYSPANWIDYTSTKVVKDWWNNNGLVSSSWHWNVPKTEGSSEYAFYTTETSFNAANATVEGTWENEVVKADLEEMADYLKLLQDKNIPVIWRPLHEAAGNIYEYQNGTAWFWWGNSGAEAFKKLWRYTFDYFKERELSNLIWVWTTQTKDDDFYPGDGYVDIVGRDIYNNTDAASIADQFTSIQQEYPTKMVTLSEMGSVATISAQWTAGAKWSYFMPWYDYDRTNDPESAAFGETNHQHANIDWWKNAMANEAVITLDEMPTLK
ncbi:glycosyl hydrolase [Maribellus mangrovi]|uniref:glycosyl hydrolase n=1 Tax=Maribellus mangrovi TaxID=3133146 RepID=UPI0030EB2656